MKKLLCIVFCISTMVFMVACSANNDNTPTATTITTTTSTNSTTVPAQSTSANTQSSTTAVSTTTTTTKAVTNGTATKKQKSGDKNSPVSTNEALDYLTDFYGETYKVNATIKEGNYQYFSIVDKKGNKYAKVKVNLKTSDVEETVLDTGEVNTYNITE